MSHKTVLAACAIGWLLAAAAANGQVANPYDADQAAIRAGALLFGTRCSECHGADAKGLAGPDLTRLWQSGVSDERIFNTVRSGVPDTIMPPSTASDRENWAVIAFLKSISTVPPFVSETGNVERGLVLFASQCARCHRARDAGGSLGPDLSRIAQVRSRDALTIAIRDPDALIAPGFKTVTLVTRDGVRISGLRKGEDAFSIQILDTDERLRGYVKTGVEEVIREERSLMPALGPDQLSNSDLEDLLAFLATLREDGI
jgi:cytochrome c oxidase cbb3-type subunit III